MLETSLLVTTSKFWNVFFYSFHLKVSLEIGVAAVPGCLDDGLYYFILEKLKIFGVTFIGTVLKLGTNIMSR